MTVWKRKNAIEQIESLLSQTIKPSKIWIYHCGNHEAINMDLLEYSPIIEYQFNTGNLGYFGRFSLSLLANTEYIYILDDDVIPTSNWIETCLSLCSKKNSIVSSSGRIIPQSNFYPENIKNEVQLKTCFIGDGDNGSTKNLCDKDTYVDYGCNSWFFKAEWLQYFWGIKPITFLTGEDIHLSASCNIKAKIKTIVPFQDGISICGNLKKKYGWDEFASWRKHDFYYSRKDVFEYFIISMLWKPMNWR